MESNEITLRKALPSDAKAIWHLLHCENKVWDVGRISKEINSLYILSLREKLVCVSHSTAIPGCGEEIASVAVHPMYPEGSVRSFLAYGLLGVIRRLPKTEVEQRIKSYLKTCRAQAGCLWFWDQVKIREERI